jgi:hypothetical protein
MWAHSLAHKKVQNEQLKQWMQCMQCEIYWANLVLVDFKRVTKGRALLDTVGVWGSNPHAPTNAFNDLASLTTFSVTPNYAIWISLKLSVQIGTERFRSSKGSGTTSACPLYIASQGGRSDRLNN